MSARLCALAALACAGCLDPLVSDEPAITSILPPGSTVPSIADDAVAAAQLAAGDGVDGLIPLRSQFAAGAAIDAWDLGPTTTAIAPLYALMRRDGQSLVPVEHPPIADTIPGDLGYSPFWEIYTVVVTDGYHGEILPSVTALDDAVRTGLVEVPVEADLVVNCPAVAPDVTIEVTAGQPAVAPHNRYYYRGRWVPYLGFGPVPMAADGSERVAVAPRYVLRREGGEPLSEPVRGIDLTGDGDLADSNDVLADDAAAASATAAYQTVPVAVVASTRSIDQAPHDAPEVRAAADLFRGGPGQGPTARVVAFTVTDEIRNWPTRRPGLVP